MYRRKLMTLGRSSLVVSLPKEWLRLNQLKKGDILSLDIQQDGSLVIFPTPKKEEAVRAVTLQVDPAEEVSSLIRRIVACYLNGYSIIHLMSTDIFTVAQQRAIRRIIGILYMRIMESTSRAIRIQTLIDESRAPIETAMRRMYIISASMFRDALDALRNHDIQLARIVYSLDNDVDQFSFFLLRLLRCAAMRPSLAGELGIDSVDCLDYQALVRGMEHVADHASRISRQLIMLDGRGLRLEGSLLEAMLLMGGEVLDAYNEAVKSFFAKDEELADSVIDRRGKIESLDRKIASSFITEHSPFRICAICSIRDSIRRIFEYATDIAEITITHMYKPPR